MYVHSAAQELEAPMDVNADSIQQELKTGTIRAKGNVSIIYRDMELNGDNAEINSKTSSGSVEGNVKFKMPSATISADRMEFNADSNTVTFDNASGVFNGQLRFTAKRIERTSERFFLFREGTLTSCLEDDPDWLLQSDEIKLRMEKFAILKNVKFRFYGVPVFYSPYFAVPAVTKRTTGLLIPSAGFSSTDGAFLKNAFFWARSEQDDATFYLDVYGKRGVREGLEYRYAFAQRTYGQLNLDYIDDHRLDENIWNVKYDHRQMFDNGIDTRARLDFESETSFTKEFGSESYFLTRRYADSFVHAEKNLEGTAMSVIGRDNRSMESQREEVFVKKPELALNIMPRQRLGLPFWADAQIVATWFGSDVSEPGAGRDISVERIYAAPTLSFPIPLGGMNFTPWITGRAASYTMTGDTNSSFTTKYYTGGLSIEGPRFYKIFNSASDDFKHTVTPKIDFTYLPGYEVDGENRNKVETLDLLDESQPENLMKFILLNRVFGRKRGGEIARLSVEQGYDFNEAARDGVQKRPFTGLLVNFDSRPLDWLLINADVNYNHYDGEADAYTNEIGFNFHDDFYLSYDRRYRRNESTYSTGLVGFRLSAKLDVEASAAYDELAREMADSVFILNYLAGCWGVSLSIGNHLRTEEVESGGVRRERETRFFINFSFKGIGDLGEKPAHVVERKI